MVTKLTLDASFACNSVYWLASLPTNELGPSRRMSDEVQTICLRVGIPFARIDFDTRNSLSAELKAIEQAAVHSRRRPIVVFDCHGDSDAGLVLSSAGEAMPWHELGVRLQQINVATGNNLCVLGVACHSLRTISPAKLDVAAPFFVLLAPPREVSVGFLEAKIPPFFQTLFARMSLTDAFHAHLSGTFEYFHCELMLFTVVRRYIKDACRGRSAAERRERLLTEIMLGGRENTAEELRRIRAQLKSGLKPDQALLDRYAHVFLVGRRCSFTMDELLATLDAS